MKRKTVFAWIRKQAGPHRADVYRLILWNVLAAALQVLVSVLSGQLVDTPALREVGGLKIGVMMVLLLVGFQILVSSFSAIGRLHSSNHLTVRLRQHFFATLVQKKYPAIIGHHSGDLLNRFTSDVDVVVNGTVDILPKFANMATMIIGGCAALILFNGWIIVAVLAVLGLLAAVGRIISGPYKQLHREAQEAEGQSRSFFQEMMANLVILKSFNGERLMEHQLSERLDTSYKANVKRGNISILISVIMNALFSFGYYSVVILGAYQLASGRAVVGITYGSLLVYLQLISRLRAPMQNISGVFSQTYMMVASAERLMELEALADEPPALPPAKQQALATAFQSLEVSHLSFSYPSEPDAETEPILEDCSFAVRRGDLVAVSALSGYGKTTLLKLLLGLYEPNAGTITVNQTVPVGADTRSLFAYVPQSNHVLSGTIRENLTLFTPDVSEEKITEALHIAVLDRPIAKLPEGLDTVLTEKGGGLSEGQLQRLAIARALLTDSPILLLDESTANLDESTERTLLQNIRELTDKTVLLITHRPTAMQVCDRVLRGENKQFIIMDKKETL